MAEGVPSWLRPNRQAMRLGFDGNSFDLTRGGVENIHGVVVASRQPKLFAVDADVTHIGTAAAWNGPSLCHFARRKINDADAAFAFGLAVYARDASIGDVKLSAVTARIEPVRAETGFDMAELDELVAVDDENTGCFHVRYVKHFAIG